MKTISSIFDIDQKMVPEECPFYDDLIIEKIDGNTAYIDSPNAPNEKIKISNDQLVHYFTFRKNFGIDKFVFKKKDVCLLISEKITDFEGLQFSGSPGYTINIIPKINSPINYIKNLDTGNFDFLLISLNDKEKWDKSTENKKYRIIFDKMKFSGTTIRNILGILPEFNKCEFKARMYSTLSIIGGDKLLRSLNKVFNKEIPLSSVLDLDKLPSFIKENFRINCDFLNASCEFLNTNGKATQFRFLHISNKDHQLVSSIFTSKWITRDWKMMKKGI